MNSSTVYCLMLTLCSILISNFCLTANARVHNHHTLVGDHGDLIAKVCKDADPVLFKANCSIILRKEPKVVEAKNYFDISKAILNMAITKTTAASNTFKEFAKNNSSPAIKECIRNYRGAVQSFISSLLELPEDPLTANYDAKVAGDQPEICSHLLSKAHIDNPTLNALNYQTKLLSMEMERSVVFVSKEMRGKKSKEMHDRGTDESSYNTRESRGIEGKAT
ncbi:hypothetical protein Fmac_023707 [Flemingia macrophylla]|uniref:Pectinesterase inhibitor domain-containing protein n=1 Tax=Flemingia macrophylla TaxID=520843 RepID=A0ABD1LMA3_9FABA